MPRKRKSNAAARLSTSPSSVPTRMAMGTGQFSPDQALAHAHPSLGEKARRPKLGGIAAKDHGVAMHGERRKMSRQSTTHKPQPQIVREQRSKMNKATPKRVPKVKKKVRKRPAKTM